MRPTHVLDLIDLDRASARPLYEQIYHGLQAMILGGRLSAGDRLPAIRALAAGWEVSRNTVVNALDQLRVEGYLEARVGSGTFVSRTLPETHLLVEPRPKPGLPPAGRTVRLSARGEAVQAELDRAPGERSGDPSNHAFSTDGPDVAAFPWETWRRLTGRLSRKAPWSLLGYQRDLGYLPLRRALAEQLSKTRGLHCTPDQVLIVAGSQEALFLSAMVLLDPGEPAWLEAPGYPGARRALLAAGARPIPVPVDEDGLNVGWGVRHHSPARLAYVTPSHQFPLGGTLSLGRRLELLEWAHATGAWIVEDDYDSEFRYRGRPLQALQGLDRGERVVYAGTLSKVLFPGLRLGYLVAPPPLVRAFAAARTAVNLHQPALPQAVLAEFIDRGHYWRHVRRMRTRYAERCTELVGSLEDLVGPELKLGPHAAGMHLVAWLPAGVDDREIARRAAELGVACQPVSAYAPVLSSSPGLVLGFGRVATEAIRPAVAALAEALRPLRDPAQAEDR